MNKSIIDNTDLKILTIVANKEPESVSSWAVCQELFAAEQKQARENHLSSVISRLDKLTKLGALRKEPHPTRKRKSVYSFIGAHFSMNGTVFIANKSLGGFVINCSYINGCPPPCKFMTEKCTLAAELRKQGLEPVLKLAEEIAKSNSNLPKMEKLEEQTCPHQ